MKRAIVIFLLILSSGLSVAQALRITQIDPPNWWAQMPKPMLMIKGEGFKGATFSLSDKTLKIERTQVSENGHYAFVWLASCPVRAETITLTISARGANAQMPYIFVARRKPGDGFAGFSSSDVMYLIMIDRFADGDLTNDGALAKSTSDSADAAAERAKPRGWHGGDLRGMTQHLDYLQRLGVTTVWPTPVYENHRFDSYHGYGATDMYRVDEHYGTLADLRALSAALHARHMKLVLDEVPNHVSPDHPWVADSPTPEWFHGTAADHLPGDSNFAALVDTHSPERDRINTTNGWFVGLLPDMNTEDPTVALYLRQNVIWWVEQTGADGIRIDTFPYVNREFWKPYLGALHELYPHLTEVGEAKSTDAVFTSSYAGGVTRLGVDTGLWTPFDFPLDGALHKAFAEGGPLTGIAGVLALDSLYPHPERLVTVLDNHDEPRFRSEAKSLAAIHMALGVLMTTRGLPQLYSGDEIAMRGGEDPDNRHDFPGGFGSSGANAFAGAGLNEEERSTLDWVSQLTRVRSSHAALSCGGQQLLESDADTLIYVRDSSKGCNTNAPVERIVIAIHRGDAKQVEVNLRQTWMEGCSALTPLIQSDSSGRVLEGNRMQLMFGSNSSAIFRCSSN